MLNNIIVFLGPSLNLAEAQAVLPHAKFLPPVRCGDMLRVLRFNPKIIVIIDGYFEHTAAVWHKEILFALEKGCEIYGAASMGALRAAELAPFGMRGCGKIYHWYADGSLIDDDEVAVLHGPAISNYATNNDALVNIRATVNSMLQHGLLTLAENEKIIETAKALPYPGRNFKKIFNELLPEKASLSCNNFIDQKKLDALELLNLIKSKASQKAFKPQKNNFAPNQSVFVRTLYNDVMCRPFPTMPSWLSEIEKIASMTRVLGDAYRYLRRLAYLWSAVYALAESNATDAEATQFGEIPIATMVAEGDANIDRAAFLQRVQLVANYLFTQDNLSAAQELSVNNMFMDLLKLAGDYAQYKNNLAQFKIDFPEYYNLLYCTALLWRAIEIEAVQFGLTPKIHQVQAFMNKFRVQYKLFSKESIEKWMIENDYNVADFSHLMERLAKLQFLTMQSNLDCFGVLQGCKNVWWYGDALYLTGFVKVGAEMLTNANYRETMHQRFSAKNPLKNDSDAFALDFLGGYSDFQKVIRDN